MTLGNVRLAVDLEFRLARRFIGSRFRLRG
jgi:hypothetical protein